MHSSTCSIATDNTGAGEMEPDTSAAPPTLITEGSHVVFQKLGGEHLRVCRLKAGQKIVIEKLQFDPAAAVGERYGMFEVSGGQLKPISFCASAAADEKTDQASTLLSSMVTGRGAGGAVAAKSGGSIFDTKN